MDVRSSVRLVFVIVLMLSSFTHLAVGQENGLNITGSVKEGRKGLEGTKVTLYRNGSVDRSLVTDGSGKFKFFFQTG